MKTGLGLYKKNRLIYAYLNLLKFNIRKLIFGFDVANQLTNRVDKVSLQLILIKNGAEIGNNCDIETGLIFHNCKDYSNLIIGNNCHIGKNCFFDLRDKIIIGNNCTISMQCTFITHQDMGKSYLGSIYNKEHAVITINDDVYIGVKSTILKGVVIEGKSIIAAGSLVIKDVQKRTIVGGVPVKLIREIDVQ